MPSNQSDSANSGPFNGGLAQRYAEEKEAYAGDADRPLEGYLVAIATYSVFAAALVAAAATRREEVPNGFSPLDIGLVGIATHKLARIISKESVTSAIRAPFTRYEKAGGPAELIEEVRGHGVRHAVGELITCPFCLGPWLATAMTGGLVLAPRLTRAATAVFTAVAISDHLQLFYAQQQKAAR
jgi:hypothetical protein